MSVMGQGPDGEQVIAQLACALGSAQLRLTTVLLPTSRSSQDSEGFHTSCGSVMTALAFDPASPSLILTWLLYSVIATSRQLEESEYQLSLRRILEASLTAPLHCVRIDVTWLSGTGSLGRCMMFDCDHWPGIQVGEREKRKGDNSNLLCRGPWPPSSLSCAPASRPQCLWIDLCRQSSVCLSHQSGCVSSLIDPYVSPSLLSFFSHILVDASHVLGVILGVRLSSE